MAKHATIEGCLTALVTPFRDGKVDFDALAKLVDWQIDQGVDGIVSVGTTGESAALDLTRASEAAGANALLHVTPYYNRPNQEGLFRHFEAIARSTKLPVILYNVPSRTACDLLTETCL